jgi:aspartate carbamoyltransferase catalytic subunit
MHPFPRNEEIPRWFDHDSRAKYFEQMKNGLYIRMALLMLYK